MTDFEDQVVRSRRAGVSDGRSDLEVAFASIVRAAGLPAPEAEWPFDWCCGHSAHEHVAEGAPRPDGRGAHVAHCRTCLGPVETRLDNRFAAMALHEFRRGRGWRFDFAWPRERLAVELEGATFAGGRHTRGAGYQADLEKYNAATLAGWRVLRFTDNHLESGYALECVERGLGMRE